MKTAYRITALVIALALMISLCACGAKHKETGKYTFYALKVDEYYVGTDVMEGRTVTLNDDGTGQLDWGDDNSGPISEWMANGEDIIIKAGVSVMNATLKDGVLIVKVSDEDQGWDMVFVNDKADTSGMSRISAAEYQAMFAEENTDETLGMYDCFGVENDSYPGYIVDMGEGFSYIQLMADSEGYICTDGTENELDSWSVSDGDITLTAQGNTLTGSYDDGVIKLYFEDKAYTAYYAKKGTNLSDYYIISQDDYKAITGQY